MAELKKRHYLLKKTLDELEIVPDWHIVNKEVVNHVLRDMASSYRESEIGIDFGYVHGIGMRAIPENLLDDLEILRYTHGAEFFKKELNPVRKEKIEEYKKTDSFKKIHADLYQEELEEQMLFGRDKFLL